MTPTKAELERQRLAAAAKAKRKRRLWSVVAFLIGVPGICSSVLSLLPRLGVVPQSSLDPADPFATPFAISNDGQLDLHDVRFSCVYIEINAVNRPVIQTPGPYGNKLGGFTTNTMVAELLETARKKTVTCPFPIPLPGPITKADIIVAVSYRESFLPFHQQTAVHFVTAASSDGKLSWFEQPMPKR